MGGFFIAQDSLPDWCSWVPDIVIIRWTYEGLMDNEYSGRDFDCDGAPNCLSNGQEVLDSAGVEDANRVTAAANLVYLVLGFQVLAYLLFLWNQPKYMVIQPRPKQA